MKKTSIYISILIVIVVGLLLYIQFGHDHEDEHDHPVAAEEPHMEENEVHLNEAQFKAAEIVLGTFSKKNLNEVISSNGYTKLPPQNQADVSVHSSGIVKNILVEEGEKVRKGQVIATIESPEFAKLKEAYLHSRSNLTFLKADYERQKTLNEEAVNANKTYEKAKSDYEMEQARFASLKKQLALLNINLGENASATVPVLAPISGYVTEIHIRIGTAITAGTSLLNIVDNSKLHVDLLVYEKDLYKVKIGQKIRFILTNQNQNEIVGTIFGVGKAFENDTKAVAIHAEIDNKDEKLISGMYVNALIDLGANAVFALPLESVVKADGRSFIFVLDKNDSGDNEYHFKRIEVKEGASQLGFVQVDVLQQINPDAKIAVDGAYYIQSHLTKSQGGGGHAH
ncbi:efflux RND transporter periplasmic adaptor subunit [Flavobacterium antarcticum]|uniref:efflux RND transporter periplasmic adaptor subunit n=1 Tax=Flavobacterium antarcticum TaxID=271155 RepID=UPI0003B49942|nr:efflux RND transporter periplasmic adaptor subunit [Flavobacterium antarcticum]